MKNTRIGPVATTLAAASMLAACGGQQPTSKSSSAAPSSARSASAQPSASSGSSSSSSAPSSNTSASSAPAHGPTGARPDSPESVSVPSGAVLSSAKVVMAGGYRSEPSSHYANFYSVWKVDGSGPGIATITYDLLDSSGKVLASRDDTINVGSGHQMTKISTAVGPAPAGAVKVRMRITKVVANPHGDDLDVSGVKITPDGHENRWPRITGRYTSKKDVVFGVSAVCYEQKTGRVVTGNGLADDAKSGATSGTFTVNVSSAPTHWNPTNCFVGQSGRAG